MVTDKPSPEDKIKWGILAHVDAEERKRIISLSGHLAFNKAVSEITKKVQKARKKSKNF